MSILTKKDLQWFNLAYFGLNKKKEKLGQKHCIKYDSG